MTKEEMFNKICEWEKDAGESFPDYFMHDNVDDSIWAHWLVSKGFKERGEAILECVASHKEKNAFCCLDQDFLYKPISLPEIEKEEDSWNGVVSYDCLYDDEAPYDSDLEDKDIALWAEFLVEHVQYLKILLDGWFENN